MNFYTRFIYFLVRRHLHITMWEPFRFTNQKHNDLYYFSSEGLVRRGNGQKRMSDVPLNWLLDPKCEIQYVCEPSRKQRDSKQRIKNATLILAILGLFVAGFLTYMARAYSYAPEIDYANEVDNGIVIEEAAAYSKVPKDYAAIRETICRHGQPAEIDIFQETCPPEVVEDTIPEATDEAYDAPEETECTDSQEPSSEVIDATESDENISDVNLDEAEMLACVIYQEAGGDAACDECRRRVADIVLNRVADPRFPDSIYGVLTQEGQYGEFAWTGVTWASRANNPGEAHAVERARRIAMEVLSGSHSDLYDNGYVWQAGFEQGSDGFWHCGHFYGR